MFPYGAIPGIIVALSRQSVQVSGKLERHLERLELDKCDALCDSEHARASGMIDKELVLVRQAMAITMRGDPQGGLAVMRPLHVDQFPPHEKSRYFSAALISWMLLGRLDAARDVVEVDGKHLRTWYAEGGLRERLAIATAAYSALADGEAVRSWGTLERARRSRRPLHKVLALLFLSRLARNGGRGDEEQALLHEAERLAPHTIAARWVAESARDARSGGPYGQVWDPSAP